MLDQAIFSKIAKKAALNQSKDEFQSFDYDGDADADVVNTPKKTGQTRLIEGPVMKQSSTSKYLEPEFNQDKLPSSFLNKYTSEKVLPNKAAGIDSSSPSPMKEGGCMSDENETISP